MAALLLAGVALRANAQAPPLWNGLERGPYAVGMSIEYHLDYSRTWMVTTPAGASTPVEHARPIRLTIWYPSTTLSAPARSFGDYLKYAADDARFAAANAFLFRRDSSAYVQGDFRGSELLYRRLIETPTAARRDAPQASGVFPLIVYAAGWNSLSPDNTVLAELLASYGYIVVTVPQLPTAATSSELAVSVGDLETQMRDLEIALGALRVRAGVDPTRTVLLGYSMGGIASLWLAGRHAGISALIGLDPSFGASQWTTFAARPEYLDVASIRIPMLVLQSGNSAVVGSQSRAIVNSLAYSDRFVLRIPEATHGDFSDFPAIMSALSAPWDSSLHTLGAAVRAHQTITRTTLQFIQAVFANTTKAFREQESSGLLFLPRAEVPSSTEISSMIATVGYDSTHAILSRVRVRYPGLAFVNQRELNGEGYRLLAAKNVTSAVGVFRVNTDFWPSSGNAYDSLADGYIAAGDVKAAIAAYRRALAVEPSYANAVAARRYLAEHRGVRPH